jgi:hypothetical protein
MFCNHHGSARSCLVYENNGLSLPMFNVYVKIAASNLVLADGRPYQRPRQDLHPKEDNLFKTCATRNGEGGDYRG